MRGIGIYAKNQLSFCVPQSKVVSAPFASVGLGENAHIAHAMAGTMRSRKRKRKLIGAICGAVVDEDHFVCRIIEAHERNQRIRDACGFVVGGGENRYKRQGRVAVLQPGLLLTPHHARIGQDDENAPAQSHEARQRTEGVYAVRAERRTL